MFTRSSIESGHMLNAARQIFAQHAEDRLRSCYEQVRGWATRSNNSISAGSPLAFLDEVNDWDSDELDFEANKVQRELSRHIVSKVLMNDPARASYEPSGMAPSSLPDTVSIKEAGTALHNVVAARKLDILPDSDVVVDADWEIQTPYSWFSKMADYDDNDMSVDAVKERVKALMVVTSREE